MKKLISLAVLLLFASVAHGQTAFTGSANDVIAVSSQPTCFPLSPNGPAYLDNLVCSNQYNTILPTATTFTTWVVTVSQPIAASSSVNFTVEDFTNGNNIASCNITAGQTTCTASVSYSAASGLYVAVKIQANSPSAYAISHVEWGLQ